MKMSYKNMTNENAACQYADDMGRAEAREAHIESLVAEDIKYLKEFGRAVDGASFDDLLDAANDTFASDWMHDYYCITWSDEKKLLAMKRFDKEALEAIENHLYEKYEEEL